MICYCRKFKSVTAAAAVTTTASPSTNKQQTDGRSRTEKFLRISRDPQGLSEQRGHLKWRWKRINRRPPPCQVEVNSAKRAEGRRNSRERTQRSTSRCETLCKVVHLLLVCSFGLVHQSEPRIKHYIVEFVALEANQFVWADRSIILRRKQVHSSVRLINRHTKCCQFSSRSPLAEYFERQ